MLWSILIATLAHREDRFLRLLGVLLEQAEKSAAGIEVVALQNNGSRGIAHYRDALLGAARGKYLCFVDDDDMVSADYVGEVVRALGTEPDCVGFRQVVTGAAALFTELSLRHENAPWDPVMYEGQATYLREFSHVMPVRSEVARQAGFTGSPLEHTGEDVAYVNRVVPLLRGRGSREVFVNEVLYHYIFSPGDTTQSGRLPSGKIARYAEHRRPRVASPHFRWCQ